MPIAGPSNHELAEELAFLGRILNGVASEVSGIRRQQNEMLEVMTKLSDKMDRREAAHLRVFMDGMMTTRSRDRLIADTLASVSDELHQLGRPRSTIRPMLRRHSIPPSDPLIIRREWNDAVGEVPPVSRGTSPTHSEVLRVSRGTSPTHLDRPTIPSEPLDSMDVEMGSTEDRVVVGGDVFAAEANVAMSEVGNLGATCHYRH